MATTLSTSGKINVATALSNDVDAGSASSSQDNTVTIKLTNGTTADKADLTWTDQRTLADSATEELDLAGSLASAFGASLTFARVKAIMVKNESTTQVLTVGGAASNAFEGWISSGGTITVRPGGAVAFYAPDVTGYEVTAGTGDLLKVANGAAGDATTYTITVVGCSA